jgi:hypothetical protein
MPVSLESVRWDELQDAYGPASKVPGLLENVSKAKGRKLHMALGELCSHVLHQGTIYSASPPVARWTIEQAKAAGPEGKEIFYSLLNGFAEAARIAFRDGRAIPCHAGGDPRDGEEIRKAILEAQAQFEGDLNDSSGGVRAQVGELLTAFEDISPTAAKLVQDRYFQESETEVRAALLSGLVRVSSQIADWDAFLSAALVHEDNKENRFTLRQTQVRRGSPGLDAASVDELVATFTGDESFFEAVHALGSDKELEAMLKAFELATETQVLRVLA